ncbi:integral membrane sensor signal transduction histidine kinase [Mycobacteroides abscessus subsp. abscessus]|nr:integral membrane sensor signal transduction histidine kinase [Mycobacteroides abscessus subsp. abscessus]
MLGVACLIIGLSSFLTIKNSLESQVSERLDQTSHRAMIFKPEDAPVRNGSAGGVDGASTQNVCETSASSSPLNAPGQSAGTLTVCVNNGNVGFSGVLDSSGDLQSLSEADVVQLKDVPAEVTAQKVDLEVGNYLVEAHALPNQPQTVVVTGIPLKDMNNTLATLVAVMAGGSLAVMVIAGLLGSWIIRRTMRPLERVSAVAAGVAQADLESQVLSRADRVQPRDSNPRSEVGAVGFALNQMLGNVQSALQAREKTENQMRAFIADASHELRTPLAAIKGYSDLLRWTENLSDSGEQSVNRIESQTARMSRLVEDLLLLARLDEGKQPVFEAVDLSEMLAESTFDMQVAAPNHRWTLNIPDDPVEVRGDRNQLQQVISNLLSNARKHTAEGTHVTASLGFAEGGFAEIRISDDGEGIDPEFIDKIFDRFTRADVARSGDAGTTGLGLPIVRAIVEAHGGSIDVQSRPGETVFQVLLPLA